MSDYDEKLEAQIQIANAMKVGELKLKLQAKGILTTTFCEKSEFVKAYAEVMVKEAKQPSVENASDNEEEESPDNGEDMPAAVNHRIQKLKLLNDEREEQMALYLEERAALEAKYHKLSKPLYEKRKDIILGNQDEEIQKEFGDEGENEETKVLGIPQFWVCAIGNMGPAAGLLCEQDIDCLEHLQDIECVDHENGEGFTLHFHFSPNEYFENSVLTKKYEVPNLLLADEPILKDVEGCEIIWKEGKSLTYREVIKQQRGKGKNAGQVRTVKKKEKVESFFHFFTPPMMPSLETMNETEAAMLEQTFDEDYDIAQAFRSHIIPKAVLWFTGEAMEKEMEAAMSGMQWPPGADGIPTGDGENPECKQS